jgi:hypothetical protein
MMRASSERKKAICTITHSVIAETVARRSGKAPFPEEIAGSQKCDHGFLPLLGDDGLLDLAALNVENRIRGFALRVDNLILPIIGNGSPPVHFRQKYFGIEQELSFAFHSTPSLRISSFENAGHFTASLQEETIRFPQYLTP